MDILDHLTPKERQLGSLQAYRHELAMATANAKYHLDNCLRISAILRSITETHSADNAV